MTARLRPFALVNSNEIASPFVDGFTVVSASTPERLALVQRWQAEQGPTVAVIDGSDLPKQHQPAASATDVLRRELAIAEAQEALAAAELKHREALEGVSRREQASHAALAALATPAPEPPQVDTLGLEAKIDQLSNAATQGALVLARLQDEVAYDLSRRHPLQTKLSRVPAVEFDEMITRRRTILSDAANLGLIDSGAAASLGRVLGSMTVDKATDPMALELFTRGTEVAELKQKWLQHPLDAEFGALDRQLGMARAEVTRLEQSDQQSAAGGLSIIEQALHIVLDEQSDGAPDGQRQAARALKREMLDGPGPLMDLSGWSTKPTAIANARLEQARIALQRLESERDKLVTKYSAVHGVDPTAQVQQFEAEVVAYLGSYDEHEALRSLSETRILPAFPPAAEVGLKNGIQRAELQAVAVRKEREAIQAARATAPQKSVGSRTDAMRAVADLEAHRRETARVEQSVAAARRALETRQAEASSSSPGTQRDNVLAFLEERLAATSDKVALVFVDTFSSVPEMVRISALDRLDTAASSRPLTYLTDDGATLAWARNHLNDSNASGL